MTKQRCHVCRGALYEKLVAFCLCEMSPAVMITGIPALVCTQCGEQVFTSAVSHQLDLVRERFDTPPDSTEELRVYRYTDG